MTKNRLVDEASLYLRQHAATPVHWWPWGEAAFAHAAATNRPVLVTVGAVACPRCRAMRRTSFEDAEVAAFQNAHFVSILVDREERPDVAQWYTAACHVVSRSSGWPVTAFALPDGRPFYAGASFAHAPEEGQPSWRALLAHLAEAWATRREALIDGAAEIAEIIARRDAGEPSGPTPDEAALSAVYEALLRRIDPHHGGVGSGPKRPCVTTLELGALLSRHLDRYELHDHEGLTLHRMADGGIYDHVGGGFASGSTDATWRVPRFDKRLCDNGLLLRVYADAGMRRVRLPERWAETMRGIADWLARDMTCEDGSLAAALDADDRGASFYGWTPDAFDAAVGADAPALRRFFGVSQRGNLEPSGASVLARTGTLDALARQLRVPKPEANARRSAACERLREVRAARALPARDDKRVTASNAYAIQGLARAGLALRDGDLLAQAASVATATLARAWDGARLLRLVESRPSGAPSVIAAFLDDGSALTLALLDLYLATGDPRWLAHARAVAEWMVSACFDDARGTFRLASACDPRLAMAPSDPLDGAVPSPVGAAALALLRLGVLTGQPRWVALTERVAATHAADVARSPIAAATLLRAQLAARVGLVTLVAVHRATTEREAQALREEAAAAVEHDDLWIVHREGAPPPLGVDPRWVEGSGLEGDASVRWVAFRGDTRSAPAGSAIAAVMGAPAGA